METEGIPILEVSTVEEFNNVIEFRQASYEQEPTRVRDARFELIDAFFLGQPIRSFPELSLPPASGRKWHSTSAVIDEGCQGWEWLEGKPVTALEKNKPGSLRFIGIPPQWWVTRIEDRQATRFG
jgi:hypothetical protein